MVEKWELLEEWIWSGFVNCDEYDWAPCREFDPPREIWLFDAAEREITHNSKRYEVELVNYGNECLLYDLSELFMEHPAFCLWLRRV